MAKTTPSKKAVAKASSPLTETNTIKRSRCSNLSDISRSADKIKARHTPATRSSPRVTKSKQAARDVSTYKSVSDAAVSPAHTLQTRPNMSPRSSSKAARQKPQNEGDELAAAQHAPAEVSRPAAPTPKRAASLKCTMAAGVATTSKAAAVAAKSSTTAAAAAGKRSPRNPTAATPVPTAEAAAAAVAAPATVKTHQRRRSAAASASTPPAAAPLQQPRRRSSAVAGAQTAPAAMLGLKKRARTAAAASGSEPGMSSPGATQLSPKTNMRRRATMPAGGLVHADPEEVQYWKEVEQEALIVEEDDSSNSDDIQQQQQQQQQQEEEEDDVPGDG